MARRSNRSRSKRRQHQPQQAVTFADALPALVGALAPGASVEPESPSASRSVWREARSQVSMEADEYVLVQYQPTEGPFSFGRDGLVSAQPPTRFLAELEELRGAQAFAYPPDD